MKDDTIYFYYAEGTSSTENVEPKIIIRDFNEADSPSVCDEEFSSEQYNQAEASFNDSFPFCRVMSVSGSILFDYYIEKDKKEVA